jgi:hypothetical protein
VTGALARSHVPAQFDVALINLQRLWGKAVKMDRWIHRSIARDFKVLVAGWQGGRVAGWQGGRVAGWQ